MKVLVSHLKLKIMEQRTHKFSFVLVVNCINRENNSGHTHQPLCNMIQI